MAIASQLPLFFCTLFIYDGRMDIRDKESRWAGIMSAFVSISQSPLSLLSWAPGCPATYYLVILLHTHVFFLPPPALPRPLLNLWSQILVWLDDNRLRIDNAGELCHFQEHSETRHLQRDGDYHSSWRGNPAPPPPPKAGCDLADTVIHCYHTESALVFFSMGA